MKTPILVTSILAVATAAASAQQPQLDRRWEPWLGCWTAAEGAAPNPTGKAPTVCVIPAAAGVDVVTVVDTAIVARDRIEALGERHPVSRDGCTGWETASWSRVGDRLYRQSEYACSGDVKRGTSEVFAVTPEWEWLDVQGLTSHGSTGVRTIRYRGAAAPDVPEIAAALAAHAAGVGMARGMAATPPTTADLIEASRAVDPAVVEAWIAEEGARFPVNGRQLLALADSGVPPRVIDVMVAMTYPGRFTVARPSARGGFGLAEAAPRAPVPDTMYAYRYPYYGLYAPPYPWGWDYYSPWSWSLYGYYSPFYYSPYGQFAPYYWGGYNGYYYGGGSIIVVSGGGGSAGRPHGQIVNGQGFRRGQGETAAQASGNTGYSREGHESSSPPPSSGSSASSAPRSSGGSSSQAGQHAKPKP